MEENLTKVVVTDIEIPFWSMVVLMIKWSLAIIPAGVVISILWIILGTSLIGFVKGWAIILQTIG